ncbi:MAG: 50S ribosomal protein L14 [Candidatus Beckwithbacteria bacterium]|nr:50S ribosomal protein L14 [Patescibacteria group bacterium]
MIQLRSTLKVADNSGGKKLRVILVHGGSKKRFGHIGDIVTASVIQAHPHAQVKSGEVVKAVIVRTRKETARKDGSYVRFDDNAAVILENVKNKEPKGTRIFGPVAREIKEFGYNKIASQAPEVL